MKTTKELARELGLLRKRSSSTSAAHHGQRKDNTAQLFKYLIVIDFESTCWEESKFRTQEIIEFPAVLLNVETGQIDSVFHHYVQPQEQPTLSKFCTKLTGISQAQVEDGIPVNLCLKKFNHWLDRLYRDMGVVCVGTVSPQPINTTCVTWSDWDLGVCLQYECKRKQLLKPMQLTSWIDLRATYRKFYDRKPNGLNGALQDLGIEFEGREHSGVDDAKNTAKLAHRMMKDGCILNVTKTLKTHERSASCAGTITAYFKAPDQVAPRHKKLSLSPQKHNTNACGKKTQEVSPKYGRKSTVSPRNKQSKTPSALARNVSDHFAVKKSSASSSGNNMKSPNIKADKVLEAGSSHTGGDAETNKSSTCTYTKNESCSTNKITVSKTPYKSHNKTPDKSSLKCTSTRTLSFTNVNDKTTPVSSEAGQSQQMSLTPKRSTTAEKSQKRKQFTPLKGVTDGVRSPRRKIVRKFSPKKFTPKDIYVDPVGNEPVGNQNNTSGQNGLQTCNGLKEQDLNIVANGHHDSDEKQLNKGGTTFKGPSKIVTKSGGSNQTNLHVTNVSASISKNFNIQNRRESFSTSTPLHQQKCSFIKPNQISPISSTTTNQLQKPSCELTSSTNPSILQTPSHYGSIASTSVSSSNFKVPNMQLSRSNVFGSSVNSSTTSNGSMMKMTPPLCKCGRRSKRRMVQSPGQNMGRFFFSCPVRSRVGAKDGCDFFKWEQSVNVLRKDMSTALSGQFTPVVRGSIKTNQSTQQKRNLGVRSVVNQRTYLR